jgi:hypothetical protein
MLQNYTVKFLPISMILLQLDFLKILCFTPVLMLQSVLKFAATSSGFHHFSFLTGPSLHDLLNRPDPFFL